MPSSISIPLALMNLYVPDPGEYEEEQQKRQEQETPAPVLPTPVPEKEVQPGDMVFNEVGRIHGKTFAVVVPAGGNFWGSFRDAEARALQVKEQGWRLADWGKDGESIKQLNWAPTLQFTPDSDSCKETNGRLCSDGLAWTSTACFPTYPDRVQGNPLDLEMCRENIGGATQISFFLNKDGKVEIGRTYDNDIGFGFTVLVKEGN